MTCGYGTGGCGPVVTTPSTTVTTTSPSPLPFTGSAAANEAAWGIGAAGLGFVLLFVACVARLHGRFAAGRRRHAR